MRGTDQCAYTAGDKILPHEKGGNRSKDASEDNTTVDNAPTDMDNIPMVYVTADKSDVQTDGNDGHTQPDEEDVPKTPEEGYVQKPLSVVTAAGKEPPTPANTAKYKIIESPLSKKSAKSPEAYNPVTFQPGKPHKAPPHQMKREG